MITNRKKLWLMISCNIYFTTQEKQNIYADEFVDKLTKEEVQFCLNHLKQEVL